MSFSSHKQLPKTLLPLPRKISYTGGNCALPLALLEQTLRYEQQDTLHPQGYILRITPEGATLAYGGNAGCFYGLITLRQLAAGGVIADTPANDTATVNATMTDTSMLNAATTDATATNTTATNTTTTDTTTTNTTATNMTATNTTATNTSIPCCIIEDAPDFEVRGVMLDISRDKVPTLTDIKALVDLFAQLKINQLQLYVEGYSYAYKSYRHLFPDETPLTPEEIRELDAYCQERLIELVPNQNTLGHMTAWLALPEFADLSETREGLTIMGRTMPPSTLDPADEKAHRLVAVLTDELLESFTSNQYNAGLDEPFELGKGKSRERCEAIGTGRVYAEYVLAMYDMATARGKRMMMWADIVAKHPEALEHIPKDITLLEWGYEAAHPFKARGEALAAAGFDFYFCPGTSAWTTFTGRTDNMLANIENAAVNGKACGAKGLLITDWGDGGHVNYPGVSYAAYCWGAALGWNADSAHAIDLEAFLNEVVFLDRRKIMGGLALDAGRYNRLEDFPLFNATLSNLIVRIGLLPKAHFHNMLQHMTKGLDAFMDAETAAALQTVIDNRKPFDYEGLMAYLDELTAKLPQARMACPHGDVLTDEFANGLRMAALGTRLRHFIETEDIAPAAGREQMKADMLALSSQIQAEHRRLWAIRNKPGGLERSLAPFVRLDDMLRQTSV